MHPPRSRRPLSGVALGGALALAACQTLPPIALSICGNGVVEPEIGEDCDLAAGAGHRCGTASEGALACRFTVDAEHTCPAGYLAGRDAICRKPIGAFAESATATMASELAWHGLADMNDDGFPDLVGLGAQRDAFVLHWGDGQGAFGPRADLSTGEVVASPALAPLVGDSAQDAILPLLRGLIVLRGNTSKVVQPSAYSTLTVASDTFDSLILPVNTSPTHSVPIVLATAAGFGVVASAIDVSPGRILTGAPLPIAPGQDVARLAGRPARGNMDPNTRPELSAEEMALGFVGDAHVYVLAVEGGHGQPDENQTVTDRLVLRQVVDLPGELTGYGLGDLGSDLFAPESILDASAPRAVHFAEFNGDDRPDLLAIASDASRTHFSAVVALGEADGRFGPAQADGLSSAALNLERPVQCPGTETAITPGGDARVPLAVADFNEDGSPDFVLPWGVMLDVHRAGAMAPCAWLPDGEIASAVAGDFNRDGHADLAVTTLSASGLTFAFGDGQGGFNAVQVPAGGWVDRMRVGDFDGDFVDDVAYAEAPASSLLGDEDGVAERSVLRVVFGRADGRVDLPESRAEMGAFNPIQSMETYREDRLRADVTDDLMLLTIGTAADGTVSRAVASLVGTPQRLMLSPLVLQRPDDRDPRIDTPVRTVAGHFGGSDAALELVAIARPPLDRARGVALAEGEPPALLYTLRSEAGAALDPTGLEVTALECAPTFSWENALVGVTDLDADGRDEIVAVDERAPIEEFFFGRAAAPSPVENDRHVGVLVLRRAGDSWTCLDDELPAEEDGTTAFALADFDGDGRVDLALAHSDPTGVAASDAAGMNGLVSVYPGDGDRFDLAAGRDLEIPAPAAESGESTGSTAEGTFPLDLAAARLDEDPAAELLISMFDRGLYRADLPEKPGEAARVSALLEEPDLVAFLAVGDVNADGLQDVVMRGLPLIRVLLGLDRPAAEAP